MVRTWCIQYLRMVMKFYPIRFFALALACLGLVMCSCWAYSFSSSALSSAKSIAIRPVENKTTEYGIEDMLVDALISQFEEDNVLKVVPESQADLIMVAGITKYVHEASDYDESYTVSEYTCRITLDMNIFYKKSEELLWEDKALTDFGIYAPGDGDSEEEGQKRAVDKLVNEIMNRTVRDW